MPSDAENLDDFLQEVIFSDQDEKGIVTGWTLSFEVMSADGRPMAGFFMGPNTPVWKALGIMKWAELLIVEKHIKPQ